MTEFETIFITHADLDETAIKTLTDKMRAVITRDAEKGSPSHILAYRDWGVRKLAYELKKTRRGRYFYVNYAAADTRLVPEFERNLRFDEKVLRFMTVQVGKVEDINARVEAAKTQKEGAPPAEHEAFGAHQRPQHGGFQGRGGYDRGGDRHDNRGPRHEGGQSFQQTDDAGAADEEMES